MPVRFSIGISKVDTDRFGFVYVRANYVAEADIADMLAYCRDHGAGVCVARCDVGDFAAMEALENAGFRLKDTLVYYEATLEPSTIPMPRSAVPIRAVRPGEGDAVSALARAAFADYFSHYHADPRFDRGKVDDAFVDWAQRSCADKGVADEVFVADDGGTLGGFATLRFNDATEGEGVLFGVHPAYQGMGIYRDFMTTGMQWCLEHGRRRMIVSTQINNYTVQRAWVRLGFLHYRSFYTLHKWFA
jgi:RimJ/RimL family protein N-acetyltransferase